MKVQSLTKRMGAGGAAGRVDTLTANVVVRKLGHVLRTAAGVMVDNLREQGDEAGAVRLHDMLAPLVDALVHFDVEAKEEPSGDEA